MCYLLAFQIHNFTFAACRCPNSADISICQAPCLLYHLSLWTLLSPNTTQPPTTTNTPDPMRIHCYPLLALEVNKTVSVSLGITSCQVSAAKIMCCAQSLSFLNKSSHFNSQILPPEILPEPSFPSEAGGIVTKLSRSCTLCTLHKLPSRDISRPTQRGFVDHPNNPTDRPAHLWTSAMDKTLARAKAPATFCLYLQRFFCLK